MPNLSDRLRQTITAQHVAHRAIHQDRLAHVFLVRGLKRDRGAGPKVLVLAIMTAVSACAGVVAGCQGEQTKHDDGAPAERVIARDQAPSVSLIGGFERVIGADSGPPQYVFGDVSSVVVDSVGSVFVADRMENEVSVFSSTGDFRFHLGRSGSGPGELQAPCCLMLKDGDELWVRDAGNARLNAYRVSRHSADYLRALRSVPGSRVLNMAITTHPDGGLIDVQGTIDFQTGDFLYERHHVNMDGRTISVYKIVPRRAGPAVTTSSGPHHGGVFYPPFSPKHLLAHAQDGDWAEAVSSEYAVRWYDADNVIRLVLTREVNDGPELTPDERRFAQFVLHDIAERTGRGSGGTVPERKPVLQGLKFDDHGRLWVLLTPRGRAPSVADVFDSGGEYVASVTWPSEVDVTDGWVSLDRVVGVTTDGNGVERIGIVQLQPTADAVHSAGGDSARPAGTSE